MLPKQKLEFDQILRGSTLGEHFGGALVGCLRQEDAKASCCVRDEGGPLRTALQGEVSNSHKLLQPKAAVVNVMVKRRG